MQTTRRQFIQQLGLAGISPVSYTHLDVYKRQNLFPTKMS